jgi:hypothetical protein
MSQVSHKIFNWLYNTLKPVHRKQKSNIFTVLAIMGETVKKFTSEQPKVLPSELKIMSICLCLLWSQSLNSQAAVLFTIPRQNKN